MGSGRAHIRALAETTARLMMPGRTLHRLAAHICSAKTLERIVEPAIADLQKEYAGAGRASRRVWVLLTGYISMLKVIAVCAMSVSNTTHDERQALWRTLAWSVGWIAAISALLTVPPLFYWSMRRWDAAMAVVPQAMPLAIPMGIAIGIAFGLSARPGRTSFAAAGQTRMPRQFAFTFHVRFALAAGTLVLASLLLAVPFHHRGLRGLIAFAASFGYLALLHTGEALAVSRALLPPLAGAWMPNVVLMALAVVVASSRFSCLRGSIVEASD